MYSLCCRPITCPNTCYKALTGMLAISLTDWGEQMGAISDEQLAMKKGLRGCVDALAVHTMIGQEAKTKESNLAVCWIDSYDLVLHELIRDSLRAIRAPLWIQDIVSRTIPKWSTNIVLKSTEGSTIAIPIWFRIEQFQGDAISPPLFCLCLAPLLIAINKEMDGVPSRGIDSYGLYGRCQTVRNK